MGKSFPRYRSTCIKSQSHHTNKAQALELEQLSTEASTIVAHGDREATLNTVG